MRAMDPGDEPWDDTCWDVRATTVGAKAKRRGGATALLGLDKKDGHPYSDGVASPFLLLVTGKPGWPQ
jgi:hypothetical protein